MATKKHKSVAEFGAKDNASKVVTAYAERVQKQLNKMGNSFEKNAKVTSKATKALQNQFASLGKAIAGAFAFTALKGSFTKAMSAFEQQNRAVQALQVQLHNIGYESKSASRGIVEFAGEMQKMIGIGDEVTMPIIQRLLSLGIALDDAKRAYKSIADFSAANNKTIEQGMEIFARAMAGSTVGLRKYGVEVEYTADKGVLLENILSEMNKDFAGMAAMLDASNAKGLTQAMLSLGDVWENVGANLANTTFFKAITASMSDLSGDLASSTFDFDLFGKGVEEVEQHIIKLQARLNVISSTKRSFWDPGLMVADVYKTTALSAEIKKYQKIVADMRYREDQDFEKQKATLEKQIALNEEKLNVLRKSSFAWGEFSDMVPEFDPMQDPVVKTAIIRADHIDMLMKSIQAEQIMESSFLERMNSWDVSTLPSIPEVLDPGDATGDVIKKMEDLAHAQEMQYQTRQQMASAAGAMASKFLGAESKIVKAIAVWQMGLEIAEATKAAAKHQWWEASQHALAATQFASVAGQSGGGAGASGGGGMNYDPYQRPEQNVTKLYVTNSFDQNGFNTTISNSAVDAVVDDMRSNGRTVEQIKKVM